MDLSEVENYLTVGEVAAVWKCSVDMVYALLKGRKLQGFRLGRDWRVSTEAMKDYERAQKTAPSEVKRYRASMESKIC